MFRTAAFSHLAACAACALGCASERPQLEQPVGRTPVIERHGMTYHADEAGRERPAPSQQRTFDAPVYRVCELPDDAEDALRFSTDSYALRERSVEILNQVANCMRRGTLQGDPIVVYGYADPRGAAEYNEKLAAQRARTVKRFLIHRGVEASRIKTVAVGEHQARGVGPETWYYDRRVEIEKAPAR